MTDLSRRSVLRGALAGAASLALPSVARGDLAPVYEQIARRYEESVRRIQQWIHQPTIAAENIGGEEGVQLMIELLRDAGFQRADRVGTDGKPGVFALLDAGAAKTFGLYFMYDVKQVDPSECPRRPGRRAWWTSLAWARPSSGGAR